MPEYHEEHDHTEQHDQPDPHVPTGPDPTKSSAADPSADAQHSQEPGDEGGEPGEDGGTEDTGEDSEDVGEEDGEAPGVPADPRGPALELLWVDPHKLIIGRNVRTEARLDPNLVRSIAERGVQEPITARRDADGSLVVRKGKRRTLAALEAGRPVVPVLLQDELHPADDDAAGQFDRVADQMEENYHRLGITEAEEVGAVQELLDLGVSPTKIARRVHRPRPEVMKLAKVARSAVAAAAMPRYDALTLDRAAVVAEFDDGTETGGEAVKALVVTAQTQPDQFEHVAQRLRDQRDQAYLLAERIAQLQADGIRTVTDNEDVEMPPRISGLRPSATDPSGTELTEQAHRECPGHAALVMLRRTWGGESKFEVSTSWVCTGPDTHGHIARWDGPKLASDSPTPARQPGPMSEEEKAARQRVIVRNKEWDSAQQVRQRFLSQLLARRTPPKDVHVFIAATLGRRGHHLRRALEGGHQLAVTLLNLQGQRHDVPVAAAAATSSPARATMLTLGMLLGAIEEALTRQTWRHADTEAVTYFTALQDWGYPLSLVERLVLDPAADADPDADAGTEQSAAGEHAEIDPADVDPEDVVRESDDPDGGEQSDTGLDALQHDDAGTGAGQNEPGTDVETGVDEGDPEREHGPAAA